MLYLSMVQTPHTRLKATRRRRPDLKATGVQGILQCQIRSLILTLLADHVLRESNHYLRLLNTFSKL